MSVVHWMSDCKSMCRAQTHSPKTAVLRAPCHTGTRSALTLVNQGLE